MCVLLIGKIIQQLIGDNIAVIFRQICFFLIKCKLSLLENLRKNLLNVVLKIMCKFNIIAIGLTCNVLFVFK